MLAGALTGMRTESQCEVNLRVLPIDQPVQYDESYNLGCSTVDSGRMLLTFQWNILPPV
jgi:hypothetical protein